jgi:hypothetical protein
MDINRLVGTRLGDYEIESLLGRGGISAAYKAIHIPPAHPVALTRDTFNCSRK